MRCIAFMIHIFEIKIYGVLSSRQIKFAAKTRKNEKNSNEIKYSSLFKSLEEKSEILETGFEVRHISFSFSQNCSAV